MKLKKHPVTEILNRGRNKAIGKNKLMDYFGVNERELLAQIMRERLDGMPILAKKTDGGGYYLPEKPEEIDSYLLLLKRGINTQINVYNAIKENLESKQAL